MYKTTIKNIKEKKINQNEKDSKNMVSITFETEIDDQKKTETITLTGSGTLKSTALV